MKIIRRFWIKTGDRHGISPGDYQVSGFFYHLKIFFRHLIMKVVSLIVSGSPFPAGLP